MRCTGRMDSTHNSILLFTRQTLPVLAFDPYIWPKTGVLLPKCQKNDIFLPKLLLNNKTLFSIYTNFRGEADF